MSVASLLAVSVAIIPSLASKAQAAPATAKKSVGELTIMASSGSQPLTAPITSFTLTAGSSGDTMTLSEATNTSVSAALALNSATSLASVTVTLDKKPNGATYNTYRLTTVTAALSQLTTSTGVVDQIVLTGGDLTSSVPSSGLPANAKSAGTITIGSATAPVTSVEVAPPTLAAGSSVPTPGAVMLVKPVDGAGVSSQLFGQGRLQSFPTVKIVADGQPGGSPLVTYTLTKATETAYTLASSAGVPTDDVTLLPSSETISVTAGGAPPPVAAPAGELTLTLADGSQVSASIESASVTGRSTSPQNTPVVVNLTKLADGSGVTNALLGEDLSGSGISAAQVVIYTAPGTTTPLVTYTLQKVGATTSESTTSAGLTDTVALETLPTNFETTYGSG